MPHPCWASELKSFEQQMFWWNTWDVTKRRNIPPLHAFEPKKKWNSDILHCGKLKDMSNKTILSNLRLTQLTKHQLINELAWLAHYAEIHYADGESMRELIPIYNCTYMVIFFWNTNFFNVDWIDEYMLDYRFVRGFALSERV